MEVKTCVREAVNLGGRRVNRGMLTGECRYLSEQVIQEVSIKKN